MSLQPHAPTASESATFWADVPIEQEWPGRREGCMHQVCSCALGAQPPCPIQQPVEDATGGQETCSGVGVAVDTSERCEAGRLAHSKPMVGKSRWGGWRATFHCCAGWEMRWTQQDALTAALAHVAEHHTKPLLAAGEAAELAQKPAEDAFWERHYADAEAEAFNFQCRIEAANRKELAASDAYWEGRIIPPVPSVGHTRGDPGVISQAADDDEPVSPTSKTAQSPFPPDPDHLSRVADDLTTLTANRRALDDAHRQGGAVTDNPWSYLDAPDLDRLDLASVLVHEWLDTPYLVGSCLTKPDYRDVDIRVILPDDRYDELFKRPTSDPLRHLLQVAITDHYVKATGLRIDFQIQRMTEANQRYDRETGTVRHPLGIYPMPCPPDESAETLWRIREVLTNHPLACEKHPDDDPIICGWKSALKDIIAIINQETDRD